jgi:hypothetical protein
VVFLRFEEKIDDDFDVMRLREIVMAGVWDWV